MIWTKDLPVLKDEWYWWRPVGNNKKIRPVLTTSFNLTEFGFRNGEWSNSPIPFPEESEDNNV